MAKKKSVHVPENDRKEVTLKDAKKAEKAAPKSEKKTDAPKKKKSSVADEAFRKRTTIIFGSILLVAIIAVVAFVAVSAGQTSHHNKSFAAQKASAAAAAKNNKHGDYDIDITDEFFYEWITELEAHLKTYKGDTFRAEGRFTVKTMKTGKQGETHTEYWLSRKVKGEDGSEGTISTQVKFNGKAPADGSWVRVVGKVDEDYGMSCIKDAAVTVVPHTGSEYVN